MKNLRKRKQTLSKYKAIKEKPKSFFDCHRTKGSEHVHGLGMFTQYLQRCILMKNCLSKGWKGTTLFQFIYSSGKLHVSCPPMMMHPLHHDKHITVLLPYSCVEFTILFQAFATPIYRISIFFERITNGVQLLEYAFGIPRANRNE